MELKSGIQMLFLPQHRHPDDLEFLSCPGQHAAVLVVQGLAQGHCRCLPPQ